MKLRPALIAFTFIAGGLAACAPKAAEPAKTAETAAPAKPAGPTGAESAAIAIKCSPSLEAPDVAAAKQAGQPDPRIPTVDAATLTNASTVGDIMHGLVIPGSEKLFAVESNDAPPATDECWKVLQDGAADVIKGAQMLKIPARSKGPDWDKAVDTVIAAATVSAGKLAAKNADDLVLDDGDMMTGCTACHQQFRGTVPPQGKLIDDGKPK